MGYLDILGEQLLDPFRIALIVGLLITANNTAAQVGRSVPLVLGMVFVAVLIPTAFGSPHGMASAIGVGIVANLLILAVLSAALRLFRRVRPD